MNHATLEQAKTVASLLSALMRQLGTGLKDPAVELPLAQLRICRALCDGSRSMSALGHEFGVSQSAMTQIADRLERARLVKRVAKEDDRRIRRLQLTPRGKKIMRIHDDVRTERILVVLGYLAPKNRKTVLAALQTLIDAGIATRARDGHPNECDLQFPSSKAIV